MAGGKPKDPFAAIREKIPTLQKHLESIKSRLATKTIPDRHSGRAAAYLDWLRLEIRRTETKLENLKLMLPATGK